MPSAGVGITEAPVLDGTKSPPELATEELTADLMPSLEGGLARPVVVACRSSERGDHKLAFLMCEPARTSPTLFGICLHLVVLSRHLQ